MPEITAFSDRVWREARAFFESHPVYELVQHRPVDESSPLVKIAEGRCILCGLTMTPTPDEFPADTLRACSLIHKWDLGRSKVCGGQVVFTLA